MSSQRLLALLIVFVSLSGCGVTVPDIKEAWDGDVPGKKYYPGIDPNSNPFDPDIPGDVILGKKVPVVPVSGAAQIEYEAKKQVYCELRRAVKAADYYGLIQKVGETPSVDEPKIPQNWGVQVTVSMEVDEQTALNPGLALNTPMHNGITHYAGEVIPTNGTNALYGESYPFVTTPQIYSFGLGGTLSGTATRIDKYNPYYSIADLLNPNYIPHRFCKEPEHDALVKQNITPPVSSPLIYNDLGITEWFLGTTAVTKLIPSSTAQQAPASAVDRTCNGKRDQKGTATPAYVSCLRSELKGLGYVGIAAEQIIASKATSSGDSGTTSKPDIFSLEEKFIIVTSGNVTPSWKLVRVSANTNASLFAAGRTRTHDLVITVGPPI